MSTDVQAFARRPYVGPLAIAVVTLAMLGWSGSTWPDPLVDFGAQLYIPWQLSHGAQLYRDVMIYNGPLSSYLYAIVFRLFGPSLHTIEAVNFTVLLGMMVLIYRLTRRASGRMAANLGGLTIALVFAFGQVVSLGNYNWMTPYVHDLTHGIVLAIVAVACTDRYLRTDRLAWAAAAGAACGLTFLTKAEPTAACAAAVAAQLAAAFWIRRAGVKQILIPTGILAASALFIIFVAALLLATAMPWATALRGVLGSWPWAFDRRVTSLNFYRTLIGLDDIPGNLKTMAGWSTAYAMAVSVLIALAAVFRARGRGASVAVFIAALVGVACVFGFVDWTTMLSPLPIVTAFTVLMAGVAAVRSRDASAAPRLALRLSLTLFAMVLLLKILMKVHAYHYGFALALPATLVAVAVMTEELPAWLQRRRWNASAFRAGALPMWLTFVAVALLLDRNQFQAKRFNVFDGTPDSFRGSTRALEVQAACQWVNANVSPAGTVAVFPQGLMINYLTRRTTPTRHINFMPPEVLSATEPATLAALAANPPEAIVIDRSAVQGDAFDLDNQYRWGGDTLRWIHQHYTPAADVNLRPPLPTLYRFEILKRRP